MPEAVRLVPVAEVRAAALEVVRAAREEINALVPGCEVVHIGATSLPDGVTKGDVDVNVRVRATQFDDAVAALASRYERAQLPNWTTSYASFIDPAQALPFGIQLTVIGSGDDFLADLNRRFADDASLRAQYDSLKQKNAPNGPDEYWQAKNDFLRRLLGRR